ncbi:50S ribosomal protein L3 [Candidatus Peregrinibacteria bacterium CG10_big_fil_rev_8_21_14_0_10_42_8]|nr:MAG: 50S ribosomal protein L3 [Candidatus Peregrinibacteria bacterium CG10_big_fil_rev_8_21_14_0_10_42_8]
MCNGRICTKIGMSRVFTENGDAVPVTYLKVEPNHVIRTKTKEKDGYNAVVLGINPKKWRTRKGNEHTKYSTIKEWEVESLDGLEAGKELTSEEFTTDAKVQITGVSKGKGFQGVIRRHNFSRGPETHGSHHHRKPGSIGMCEFPGRVMKGKKMPGRMGNDQITLKKREILNCDVEKGVIAVKGPVPGPNGSRLYVTLTPAS